MSTEPLENGTETTAKPRSRQRTADKPPRAKRRNFQVELAELASNAFLALKMIRLANKATSPEAKKEFSEAAENFLFEALPDSLTESV